MEVETKIPQDGNAMAIETTEETGVTTTNIVNRIPASTSSRKHPRHHHQHRPSARSSMKRRGSFGSNKQESRGSNDGSGSQGRESLSSSVVVPRRSSHGASSPKRCKPMDLEEVFEQLDPNHPDQARRIFQRRKMLQKGKNTLGYQNYLRQVPKAARVPRSMKTPGTPDPHLKISAKRWQGLVKAWRIALHDYDPPDMMGSGMMGEESIECLEDEDDGTTEDCKAASAGIGPGAVGVRAQELEKAAAMGLVVESDELPSAGPVVVASPMKGVMMGLEGDEDDDALLDASSPISVLTEGSMRRRRLSLDNDNNRAETKDPAAPARLVVARPRRWADEDSSDDDDDLL